MGNIDPRDLAEIEQSFKRTKPRLHTESLDLTQMHKAVNFGVPTLSADKEEPVKINVASPKIKISIKPSTSSTEKIVQEIPENISKKGEFSATSISFIPYGGSFLNASQALEHITKDEKAFQILEDNYLGLEHIQFIIGKIDKIYDMPQSQKLILRHFFEKIIHHKEHINSARSKAKDVLTKLKDEKFRTRLSTEIQRMFRGSGDLYKYYEEFKAIDEQTKKFFLNRITNIDYYILKKIKEIIIFNQNDLFFRYEEINEFAKVLEARNVLMSHFHLQVEQLASQEKLAEKFATELDDLLEKLVAIAKDYGKTGRYGRVVNRSSGLQDRYKIDYLKKINTIIEPAIAKIQKTKLDLETGDFLSIDLLKQSIKNIIVKDIKSACDLTYQNIIKKEIK